MSKNNNYLYLSLVFIATLYANSCGPIKGGSTTSGSSCLISQVSEDDSITHTAVTRSGGFDELAQSFTATDNSTISNIKVKLIQDGTIATTTQTVTISLYSNNSGTPGSALASSSLAVGYISSTASTYTFTLNSSVTLSSSTIYWIVIKGNYTHTSNTTNLIRWIGTSGSTDRYTSGQAMQDSGGGWSSPFGTTKDFVFQVGCE